MNYRFVSVRVILNIAIKRNMLLKAIPHAILYQEEINEQKKA